MSNTNNRIIFRGTGLFNRQQNAGFLWRILALSICLIFILAGTAHAQFAGGTGTADDPYQVATAEHLNNVRNHLDAHFLQTADINLGVAPWNTAPGWVPIGSRDEGDRFTGNYDGGGFTISNLTINRGGDYRNFPRDQGLFGYLHGARVSNLNISEADILTFRTDSAGGGSDVGILSGYAGSAIIENIMVSGTVIGGSHIGGLLGTFYGGNLMNVSADVAVQGTIQATGSGNQIGGLIGSIYGVVESGGKSAIRYASVTGTVTGRNNIGGLVGSTSELWPLFTDSYSRASVSGVDRVGGIIGHSHSGEFHRVYSTGLVSGTGDNVGGFVGSTHWGARTHDCYWDVESSNQQESAGTGVTGKTTAQMKQQATYKHYNFKLLWEIDEGNDYPVFQDFGQFTPQQPVELTNLNGAGIPENPYIITTIHELAAMHQDLTASYRLANDLDLASTVIWNHGRGWNPVGRWQAGFSAFTGTFDGGGNTIRNLVINGRANQQGLFGFCDSVTLENIHLVDADIRAGGQAGILADNMTGVNIVENVSVAGKIIATGSYVGGMIGRFNNGNLMNVSADILVQASGSYVGGLIGSIALGQVSYASVQGTVQGGSHVGGLIGSAGSSGTNFLGLLTNSYSRAAVSGENNVGGIIGKTWSGDFDRVYSSGLVTGTGDNVGGLIGIAHRSPNFHNCYWDTTTSGQAESAGGEGRTTAQMQRQATYERYNFKLLWAIDENKNYPVLQGLGQYTPQQPIELTDLNGAGTPENPYIITTIHELAAMHHDTSASYRLGNNLDMSDTIIWNHGQGWNPVGRWQSGFSTFTGAFDGGGYTLRNLVINGRADQRGLFGSAEGAAIENVHLADADVRCGSDCAILAGRMWSNTIVDNISVAGQVISTGSRIGGLIGRTDGGYYTPRDSLTRVSSASTVKGVNEVGGLVGRIQDTNITLAFATGSVQGEQRVGGLIGDLGSTASTLSDTYSRASVSGVERVGGLIGSATRGTISRSFSTGAVSGTGDNVGGFIGDPGHFPTFANNYWDTQTTGQSGAVGKDGVEGRTTTQMTHPYAANTYADWDFEDVWTADVNYTLNNGYPLLQAIPERHTVTINIGSEGGQVLGAGEYLHGAWVELTAIPDKGYRFLHWKDELGRIYTDRTIAFLATEGRTFTAYFEELKAALPGVLMLLLDKE